MRNKITVLVLMMIAFVSLSNAQRVGINTTTPLNTLDVRGSIRFGGNNNYLKFDSATGKFEWTGASLFVPTSQQIISHSASAEGLYTGGGKLQYANQFGNPVFYTDWSTGNGYFSGNLGIGITTPTAKLQIRDGVSGISPFFSARMVVETNSHSYINLLSPDPFETGILFGSGTNAANGVLSYNNSLTPKGFLFCTNGNQPRMVIDNAGRVGIGTQTPQHNLHVYAGASGSSAPFGSDLFTLESNGSINMAFLTPDAGESTIWYSSPSKPLGGGIFYNNPVTPNGFVFRANNVPRFTIAGTGNIGIGMNNPLSKFQIYGEESTANGNAAAIQLANGAPGSGFNNWYLRAGATGTYTPPGGFSISDNNAYRFVIDNTGKVGFGTLTPGGAVDIKSSESYQLVLENTNLNPIGYTRIVMNTPGFPPFFSGGSWQIASMIGISYTFDRFIISDLGSDILTLIGNGNATLLGTLTQSSDARLKKDLAPLQNSLQKIKQLNGYNFYWKDKKADNSLQTGVLAQEVEKLFPSLVREDSKGILSVNYSGFIPVLIESIKEQQLLIEKQQNQIDELKKLVEKIIKQYNVGQ